MLQAVLVSAAEANLAVMEQPQVHNLDLRFLALTPLTKSEELGLNLEISSISALKLLFFIL